MTFLPSAIPAPPAPVQFEGRWFRLEDPALWIATARHSIDFFDLHARDGISGTYLSEIRDDGSPASHKVHVLALSRMIYALSFTSAQLPENLDKARQAAAWLLSTMIGHDSYGPYFIATVDLDQPLEPEDTLRIWEQSYGLCGLVELFRVTRDEALLHQIHGLYNALVARFMDPGPLGGFCTDYSLEQGLQLDTKSYASTVYPLTAFLINLWEADPSQHLSYERVLARIMDIVFKHFWNEELGWVNETFSADWNPRIDAEGRPTFNANTGHDFQTAWLLLRASRWAFLTTTSRDAMRKLGFHILDTTLSKPIWGEARAGFYREMDPVTNTPTTYCKDGWQHGEALPTLALANRMTNRPRYAEALHNLAAFYLETFFDTEQGGEFFSVDRENQPIRSEWKGSKGKSSYHVAETARFMIAYLGKGSGR